MRKLVRFSSILLLAAVLFSCKQNISYDESKSQGKQGLGQQTEKQADKADEYVNVKLAVNKAAREAFVPDEDGSKNYSFDLTGYLDGSKTLTNIMHWDNFDAIAGSEFQIKRGSWELILTASAGDYNESTKEWNVYPVLEGTCSKTITKAETIPFKLEKIPDSEAPGEYFMYLHFPKSENWIISASVKDLATLNVLDEQYNPSIKKDSDDFAEIHGKLPAGEYKLGVKFVYKSGSLEMTSVVPVFMVIAPGCQTHGDISLDCDKLNMAHPIIYADYNAGKGNYSLPDGFPTVFTSYESYTLPTPTRTDSENYEFVGWFTDGGFGKDSKIEKTPLYTENGELELVLYPKWLAKTSPYFSLEDKEGINVVLSDKTKELFENKQASSLQYFVKNAETNLELNFWFTSDAVIEMNYEWNDPFVENGTDYEAYLIIGDISGDIRTENLGITTKTGIGEDKHFYDEAEYELDENGILHITNIPEYKDYDSDATFREEYIIAIWEGSGWDDSPEWKDNNVWNDFQETSLDFDLNPWLEKHQLYGKPFMTLCSRDYWYKGKKYSIGFGSPTFTYGDLNHMYYYESTGDFFEYGWGVRYFNTYNNDTMEPVEIKQDSIVFTLKRDVKESVSSNSEMIQVVQTTLRMEEGKRYKVSYKVEAPKDSISAMLWDDKVSTSISNGGGYNSLDNVAEEMSLVTRDPIENGPRNITILFFPKKKGKYTITDLRVTEIESIKVTLVDGDKEWKIVEVDEGTNIENGLGVGEPYRDGYYFTGWYSDAELTNKVKFITKDTTTLYAGFEAKKTSENVINVSMSADNENGTPKYQRYFRQYGTKESIKQLQTTITIDTSNIESYISPLNGEYTDSDAKYIIDENGGTIRCRAVVGLIFDMHCTKTVEDVNYYDIVVLAYRPSDKGFYIERYNEIPENALNTLTNASSFKDSADQFISNTSENVFYEYNENYSWVYEGWAYIDKQYSESKSYTHNFDVSITQPTPGTYTINLAGKNYTYNPSDDSSTHPEWYDKDGYRMGAVGYYANAPLGTRVYARFDTLTNPDEFWEPTTYPEESSVSIDYTNYTSEYSIKVKNDSYENVVCFKGTPSASTLISGAKAGMTTCLKLDQNLFNQSEDFVLWVFTEDDYINCKKDFSQLTRTPFALIYAYYNADSDSNANMVYTISSNLGGDAYLILNNTTNYNVELRQNGIYGEPLTLASANTIQIKLDVNYGDYYIYPVFRKYQKNIGEILTWLPIVEASRKPVYLAFSLSQGDAYSYEFNVIKWFDPYSFSECTVPGSAYITITNGRKTGISLYKGTTAEAAITSTGGKVINSGKSLVFEVPMSATGNSIDSSAIVSGWKVGYSDDKVDVSEVTVEAGKMYYLDVTEDADSASIKAEWRIKSDNNELASDNIYFND